MNVKMLRRARLARGWSVAEAARRVELNSVHYYRIEAGKVKRPHVPTVRRLAKIFGVTPGQIEGLERWTLKGKTGKGGA